MNKIFIRRKKLIELLKEKQREVRKSNQSIKIKCIEEKDKQGARDWQFYEDGNDNAFNLIIENLKRGKL